MMHTGPCPTCGCSCGSPRYFGADFGWGDRTIFVVGDPTIPFSATLPRDDFYGSIDIAPPARTAFVEFKEPARRQGKTSTREFYQRINRKAWER